MRLKTTEQVFLLNFCLSLLYFDRTCCVSLRIKNRHELQGENKPSDVWKGTITFGQEEAFGGQHFRNEGIELDGKRNVDEEMQADSPMVVKSMGENGADSSSSKAAFDRMQPTVLCTNDFMKFCAQGPGFSSLLLNRAGTPLSLNQLPGDCGYSVQRTQFGFVFLVPYNGCDVMNQHGNNLLQMTWHGNPVTLSCPVSPGTQTEKETVAPTMPSKNNPKEPSQVQQDLQQLMMNFPSHSVTPPASEAQATAAKPSENMQQAQNMQQQLVNPYLLYHGLPNPFGMKDPSATTAAQTTEATTMASKDPAQQQQQLMRPYFVPGYYYNPHAVKDPSATTAAPTTEATTVASKVPSQQEQLQQQQQMQMVNPYLLYHGLPNPFGMKDPSATTAAPTTEATTMASKDPAQQQQQQQLMHPYFFHPGYYYNPHAVKDPSATTVAPTTEATNMASKVPAQQQQMMMHPIFYSGYYNSLSVMDPSATSAAPATEAPTVASKVPSQQEQLQQQQQMQMVNPYGIYQGLPNPFNMKDPSATTAAPTTEATTMASKVPQQQQQQMMGPYYFYPGLPNPFSVKDPSDPTAAPTTTVASKVPSPQQQQQQLMSHFLIYPAYNHQTVKDPSATTAAPTTGATSSPGKGHSQQQQQQQQQQPPHYYYYSSYFNPVPMKNPSATAAPTMPPTAVPQQQQQQQLMQQLMQQQQQAMQQKPQQQQQQVMQPQQQQQVMQQQQQQLMQQLMQQQQQAMQQKPQQQQQQVMQQPQQQLMQQYWYPSPNHPLPGKDTMVTTAAPTTTASKIPPQEQQQQQFMNPYQIFNQYPQYTPSKIPGSTAAPATTPQSQNQVDTSNFRPFFIRYLNPSDINRPQQAKSKSWTQVFSHNYPFMDPHHNTKDKAMFPK
ncbi:uncharacterized protein LOC134465229 [Engraulis encrasicolus]|uniref:uncharacterized protein LOC134465229 n=1 Tax=Engraulis encrasicolus TaxID=184585 RepID=UPI002FD72C50